MKWLKKYWWLVLTVAMLAYFSQIRIEGLLVQAFFLTVEPVAILALMSQRTRRLFAIPLLTLPLYYYSHLPYYLSVSFSLTDFDTLNTWFSYAIGPIGFGALALVLLFWKSEKSFLKAPFIFFSVIYIVTYFWSIPYLGFIGSFGITISFALVVWNDLKERGASLVWYYVLFLGIASSIPYYISMELAQPIDFDTSIWSIVSLPYGYSLIGGGIGFMIMLYFCSVKLKKIKVIILAASVMILMGIGIIVDVKDKKNMELLKEVDHLENSNVMHREKAELEALSALNAEAQARLRMKELEKQLENCQNQ